MTPCNGDCARCRPAIEDGGECPLQWEDDFCNPFIRIREAEE